MKSPVFELIMIGLIVCISTASLAQDSQEQATPSAVRARDSASKVASAPTVDERQSDIISTAKTLIKKGNFEEARLLLIRIDAKKPQAPQAAQLLYELSEYWSTHGYRLLKTNVPSQPGMGLNSKAVGNTQRPGTPSESEMASLYVDSVLYGFASGAVWFGGVFEVDSTAGVVLPALALAGASSYGVYRLKQDGYLSRGMPRTISLGLRIGFIESTLLASYVGTQYQNINPKAVLVGAWTGTTLGGVIGGLLAHKRPISPARASLIESTAIWTGILSTMGHHAITSGDTDNEILLTTSVGVLGGAALGAVIEHDSTLTESRVRYLDLGAFAGALVTGGLYASFAPSNAPAFLTHGIIATGIASGWYTAYTLTKPGELSARTPSKINLRLVALPTHDGGVNVGSWGQF